MEQLHKQIGNNIKNYLEIKGRKHSWVIDRLNLDEKEFQQVLNGTDIPNFSDYIQKISKLFRKEEDYFYPNNYVPPLSLEEIQKKDDFLYQVSKNYQGNDKEAFMESMVIFNDFVEMIDILSTFSEEPKYKEL